jgi:hypothetical protein
MSNHVSPITIQTSTTEPGVINPDEAKPPVIQDENALAPPSVITPISAQSEPDFVSIALDDLLRHYQYQTQEYLLVIDSRIKVLAQDGEFSRRFNEIMEHLVGVSEDWRGVALSFARFLLNVAPLNANELLGTVYANVFSDEIGITDRLQQFAESWMLPYGAFLNAEVPIPDRFKQRDKLHAAGINIDIKAIRSQPLIWWQHIADPSLDYALNMLQQALRDKPSLKLL